MGAALIWNNPGNNLCFLWTKTESVWCRYLWAILPLTPRAILLVKPTKEPKQFQSTTEPGLMNKISILATAFIRQQFSKNISCFGNILYCCLKVHLLWRSLLVKLQAALIHYYIAPSCLGSLRRCDTKSIILWCVAKVSKTGIIVVKYGWDFNNKLRQCKWAFSLTEVHKATADILQRSSVQLILVRCLMKLACAN